MQNSYSQWAASSRNPALVVFCEAARGEGFRHKTSKASGDRESRHIPVLARIVPEKTAEKIPRETRLRHAGRSS